MRALRLAVVVCVASLLAAAPAHGFFIKEYGSTQSASSGMVLGPDGNFWVSEQFAGTVARISTDGTLLSRYDVGANPLTVANGPDGRVWVAVNGASKLVWIDALSPTPTTHDVPVDSPCPPVALADGTDGRMYFSLPSDGCNDGQSRMGSVSATGMGGVTLASAGGGKVFDLETVGGKLFAPDFDGGVVRRLAPGSLAVETSVSVPTPGSAPDGIASDAAGNVLITDWGTGKIAAFPAAQNGGVALECTPTGGSLVNPFGIVAAPDGSIYVAGKSSANVVRIDPGCSGFQFYPVPDSEPFAIINGVDNDIWFSDQKKTRILRLVNDKPRLAPGKARATGPTSAAVAAVVNPRGNPTKVVFDYGTSAKYGKTTKPVRIPNGVDPVDATGVLSKLRSDTTYHVRARASNAEGGSAGPDQKIKTAPFPELATSTSIRVVLVEGEAVKVEEISITRLRGTETATIRCKGRRCPFKAKSFRLKGKSKTFKSSLLRDRVLPPGTVLSVQVTAPRTIGTSTVLRVTGGNAPEIKRACVRPGDKRPSSCP